MNTVQVSREVVRTLTKDALKLRVMEFGRNHPDRGSFILSDVLGTVWSSEFIPFYELYGSRNSVAGQEMGKLLAKVGRELNLKSVKESRFCKKDAITRYFF